MFLASWCPKSYHPKQYHPKQNPAHFFGMIFSQSLCFWGFNVKHSTIVIHTKASAVQHYIY